MPLKNGELTLGELKRLVKQYNKQMGFDAKGMKRPELLAKIKELGYDVDHVNQKLKRIKEKVKKIPVNVDLPAVKPRATKEQALKNKKVKAEKKAQDRVTTIKDAEVKKGLLKKVVRRKRASKKEEGPSANILKKEDKARADLVEYLKSHTFILPSDKRLIDKIMKDKEKYLVSSFKTGTPSTSGKYKDKPVFQISVLQFNKGRSKDPTDYSIGPAGDGGMIPMNPK